MQGVIVVLMLTMAILFAATVHGRKNSQTKQDKVWKDRRTKCQKQTCIQFIPEEAYNCVNNCTSSTCFDEVYGDMPLEDGEIDKERSRKFTNCLRKEVKQEVTRRKQETTSS